MDPRMMAMLAAKQQQNQQQPVAGQPAPQGQPVIGQNPFMHIINGMQPAGGQGQPQQPQLPPQQNVPSGQAPKNQLQPGVDGGNTKPLLSAVQAIQTYIAGSTDATEIQIARSIVQLLVKLIARDQQSQQAQLGQ